MLKRCWCWRSVSLILKSFLSQGSRFLHRDGRHNWWLEVKYLNAPVTIKNSGNAFGKTLTDPVEDVSSVVDRSAVRGCSFDGRHNYGTSSLSLPDTFAPAEFLLRRILPSCGFDSHPAHQFNEVTMGEARCQVVQWSMDGVTWVTYVAPLVTHDLLTGEPFKPSLRLVEVEIEKP